MDTPIIKCTKCNKVIPSRTRNMGNEVCYSCKRERIRIYDAERSRKRREVKSKVSSSKSTAMRDLEKKLWLQTQRQTRGLKPLQD